MNTISLKIKTHEMNACLDSWEWLLREDLVRLDARARKMCQEMQAAGVPKHMFEPFIAEQFRELCESITTQAKEVENMTPVPRKDKDKEARDAAPSEVTIRKLTPEERERLDAMPRQRITDRYGERRREPVALGSRRRLHDV